MEATTLVMRYVHPPAHIGSLRVNRVRQHLPKRTAHGGPSL